MLNSWMADLKRSVNNTVTEYSLLAIAVVPFLVAAGLATAALVIWLAAALGLIAALLVMACVFAFIGLMVMMLAKSYEEPQTTHSATTGTDASATQATLMDGAAGTALGLALAHPSMAFAALRILLRNLPALITGAILGGLLFSDTRQPAASASGAGAPATDPLREPDVEPIAVIRPTTNGVDREHRPSL